VELENFQVKLYGGVVVGDKRKGLGLFTNYKLKLRFYYFDGKLQI